ncbi:DUF3859 domain-containing protein [Ferrimonas balearica]|uniref:DUF3859 domain-containing protein n=1 Tax=Ferrimonas balearica TaxID=44012 RepID=UPI001F403887|nr:DUF3859 domain-containing protein [Ferrimonas balearica]MBY6019415.1 DUF3859 domain-containing protein [Halomonas denitrificans]MBY6096234.1 DUF3859 domain-containing protein [Ferrimonas balearica]
MPRTFLALLALLISAIASAEVVEKGLFANDNHDAPLLLSSERVPAKLGTLFGFRFLPEPDWDQSRPLQVVVQHPPMPPLGHEASGWTQYLQPGQPNTVVWEFEYQEELLPGEWVIFLMQDDEPLFMERFEVILLPEAQFL